MVQCIDENCREDICATIQLVVSRYEAPKKKEELILRKVIKHLHDTADKGLKYVLLDLASKRLEVYKDASFVNARGPKVQLRFLLLRVESVRGAKIIHYGRISCRRVTRYVLARDMHSLVLGFDIEYVLENIIPELFGREMPIEATLILDQFLTCCGLARRDSRNFSQIEICRLKESCDIGESSKIGWFHRDVNPDDVLRNSTDRNE